jgi:hypothetical protein
MKHISIDNPITLMYVLSDTTQAYERIRGEYIVTDYDPTLYMDVYEIKGDFISRGDDYIITSMSLKDNIGLISSIDTKRICPLYDTIEFLNAFKLPYGFRYPVGINTANKYKFVDTPDIGVDVANLHDILVLDKDIVGSGIALAPQNNTQKGSLIDFQIDQFINYFDGLNIIGCNKSTVCLRDPRSMLSYVSGLELFISVDTWLARLAKLMFDNTIILRGPGQVGTLFADTCDECKGGCEYPTCQRLMAVTPQKVMMSL